MGLGLGLGLKLGLGLGFRALTLILTLTLTLTVLKVALLLGVHAHFSCPVLDLAQLQQRGFYAVGNRPEPGAKVHARYHLLVDATGAPA